MTFIDPAPLTRTITRLLEHIEAMPMDAEMRLEQYDKFAKAVILQMKAVQDITAYNQQTATQDTQTKYLNYDDLPPPSPEDRTRFIKRLTRLYDRLNDSGKIQ